MKDLPVVSIITIVKNGGKVLEGTIKSVIKQTYPKVEYIIIDGGSTDNTLQTIKRYGKRISQWISEPDKGLYDAMNKGLKIAKGKYVWFINAGDQIYDRNTLAKVFKKELNGDAYYGDTALINSNGKEIGMWWRKAPEKLTWKDMISGMIISHQSFIIRNALAEKYDSRYMISADVDWVISGLKRSKKITNTHLILSKYRTGGLSAQRWIMAWSERYKILSLHFGPVSAFVNQLMLIPKFLAHKLIRRPIH